MSQSTRFRVFIIPAANARLIGIRLIIGDPDDLNSLEAGIRLQGYIDSLADIAIVEHEMRCLDARRQYGLEPVLDYGRHGDP